MANFTTGTIDLSAENTFDNVIMGDGDTMTFSNSGTGGAAGSCIIVTGDFTVSGTAAITLRNNANLTPGTVTILGTARDLDAATLNYGAGGNGGSAGYVTAGSGGAGGSTADGSNGQNAPADPVTAYGGTGGAYPQGAGTAGGSDPNSPSYCGGGGGGGGAGEHGTSCESVAFYVQGNVSITGGTITGEGTAGSNGGSGGAGGYGGSNAISSAGGGGGGGGAGGAGGHGGNLYLFHLGTAAEAFDTKSLSGGNGGAGGSGGAAGGGAATTGTAGSNGTGGATVAGNTGIVELIEVDTIPTITTDSVTEIFATQAGASANVSTDGGNTITERGFCVAETADPDTSDTKYTVSGTTGSFTDTLDSLDADTTYHVRAFATNSEGTAYGADIEFKTIKSFIPTNIIST